MFIFLVYIFFLFGLFNYKFIEYNDTILLSVFLIYFFFLIYLCLKDHIKFWNLGRFIKIYFIFRFLFRNLFFNIYAYIQGLLLRKQIIIKFKLKLKYFIFSLVKRLYKNLNNFFFFLFYCLLFQIYYKFFKFEINFIIFFYSLIFNYRNDAILLFY